MSDFTPLCSEVSHSPFLVLDIESKDGDTQKAGFTRPFMVGVFDGVNYYSFFDEPNMKEPWETRFFSCGGCIDKVMRFILQPKFRGYNIYAHNAGRFDFLFLLPWIRTCSDWLFEILPVASSIQLLTVKDRNRNGEADWKFLDSLRLIPTTLDKAAKSFGLPGKLSHDLNLEERDPRWEEYNREDCVQLFGILEKFHHYVEKVLEGEVGITAPSTAIKLIRRKFLKEPIARHEETHEFIRAGYYGGRVEPFETVGKNLRYYDFNSSYPAAMLQPMPGGKSYRGRGKPPERFAKSGWIGFVKCDVRVPSTLHIPPLPIRGDGLSAPNKLIFPTGNLSGTWEWEELSMAVEYGCEIVRWDYSVWYSPVYLFRDFVLELYSYRDKSKPGYTQGMADIAKILMNSAYGKFGMKTERRKIWHRDDPELPTDAVPVNGDENSVVWASEEVVDAPYIMPQVSARVTALGRVALYRGMMQAIERGGKVYYCDTDSIITDAELESSTELGKLKDEIPEYSGKIQGKFIGPKMYILESDPEFLKVKAKGIQKPRGASVTSYREMVEKLVAGEEVSQLRLEKIGSMARRDFLTGPQMIDIKKRLLPDRAKRIINEDGTTSPYNIKMW